MSTVQRQSLLFNLQRNNGHETKQIFVSWKKQALALARWRNHLHFSIACQKCDVIPNTIHVQTSVVSHQAAHIVQRTRRQLLAVFIRKCHQALFNIQRAIHDATQSFKSAVDRHVFAECEEAITAAQRRTFDKTRQRQKRKLDSLIRQWDQRLRDEARQRRIRNAIVNVSPSEEVATKAKWVTNSSSKTLTNEQLQVLGRGLSYVPTPTTPPTVDMLVAVEDGLRQFGRSAVYGGPVARSDNLDRQGEVRSAAITLLAAAKRATAPNLTKGERRALTDLRKDATLSILPADKGRATVVMDKSDYLGKVNSMLADTNMYTPIANDPTVSYRNQLQSVVRQIKTYAPKEVIHSIWPTSSTPPLFFGQPKVHKEGIPLRPIVATRGSIFDGITKECARILTPMVGNSHHLRDSVDLTNRLKSQKVPDDYVLVSFDLVSMFTNIPQEGALAAAKARLESDTDLNRRTPIKMEHIIDLLRLDLKLAYFRFDGKYYAQPRGLGMGKSTSSPLSDIFMEDYEVKALANFREAHGHDSILFWYRKADDTITAVKRTLSDTLHNYLNSISPDIQWTMEQEQDGKIPMLDVLIKREGDGLNSQFIANPPTPTNTCTSHAPLQYKISTIRSLTRHAELIRSTNELKEEEMLSVKKALTINGYPKWAFEKARFRPREPQTEEQELGRGPHQGPLATAPHEGLGSITQTQGGELQVATVARSATPAHSPPSPSEGEDMALSQASTAQQSQATEPQPRPEGAKRSNGLIRLPYLSGTTEPLAKLFRGIGIACAISSRGSLRELLVKPKDKLPPTEKAGIIYHIPCAGVNGEACAASYVGESSRCLSARFREHESGRASSQGIFASAVAQHASETGHLFRFEDASTLDTDSNWYTRGIREAVFIRALKPNLNRDQGRHDLSEIYNALINKAIKPIPAPRPHHHTPRPQRRGRGRPPNSQPTPATEALLIGAPGPPQTATLDPVSLSVGQSSPEPQPPRRVQPMRAARQRVAFSQP